MARSPKPSREDLERMAVRGWLRGSKPYGGGPMFGGGRGRKRRGDVRVALLLLIAEQPRNGYQLMDAVEERSGGRWRPSPGSVYPTLAQLEDEGLIQTVQAEGAKQFELTEAGRQHAQELGGRDAPWEGPCEPGEEFALAVHDLVGQVHLAAMQVAKAGDVQQLKQAADRLAQTKRDLYRILAEEADD